MKKSWKQRAKRRLEQLDAAEERAEQLESQLRLAHESEKRAHERAEYEESERLTVEQQRDQNGLALIDLCDEFARIGQAALQRVTGSVPHPPGNPGTFLTWEEYIEATEHLPTRVAAAEESAGVAEGTISSALEVVTVRMMRGFAANAVSAIRADPDAGPIAQNVVASLRDLLDTAANEGEAERIPPEAIARLAPPSVPETYRLLVNAAQEVDELISADGPPFRFDSLDLSPDAQSALLSLHDRLNDVTRIFFPSWEFPQRADRCGECGVVLDRLGGGHKPSCSRAVDPDKLP